MTRRFQKNTKVLNNPKGKPVHITLQYSIRIISNHIKNTKKKPYLKQYLQRESNNPKLPIIAP